MDLRYAVLFVRADGVLSKRGDGNNAFALMDESAMHALDEAVDRLQKMKDKVDKVHIYILTDLFGDEYTASNFKSDYAKHESAKHVMEIASSTKTSVAWTEWICTLLMQKQNTYKDSAYALIYSQKVNNVLPNGMGDVSVILRDDKLMDLEEVVKTVDVISNSTGIGRLVYYRAEDVQNRNKTVSGVGSGLSILSNLLVEMKIASSGIRSRNSERQEEAKETIRQLRGAFNDQMKETKADLDAIYNLFKNELSAYENVL
jgi:hypothetical protein